MSGVELASRRAYNWSNERVQILYEALLKEKDALKNQTVTSPGVKHSKQLAWKRVLDACNESYNDEKSLAQVQSKVRNFNIEAKRRYNKLVQEMRKSGEGTFEDNIRPLLNRADELSLKYQGFETAAGIEGTERTELIPVVDFSLSQADWQSTSPTNVKACTSGESDTSEECAEIEYTSEDTGLNESLSKKRRLSGGHEDEEAKLIVQLTQVRKKKKEKLEEERRKSVEKAKAEKLKKEEEQRRLKQAEVIQNTVQENVSDPETNVPCNKSEHCCSCKLSQVMVASINQQNELLKELVSANQKIGDILAKDTDLSNTIQDNCLNSTNDILFEVKEKDDMVMGTSDMQLNKDDPKKEK